LLTQALGDVTERGRRGSELHGANGQSRGARAMALVGAPVAVVVGGVDHDSHEDWWHCRWWKRTLGGLVLNGKTSSKPLPLS
jgi:hypothetical protein